MPRKSAKQTGLEIIIGLILVGILAIVALFNFIVENPWILLIVSAVVVFAIWFNKREKELQEQKDNDMREQKENDAREREEKKLQEFLIERDKKAKEKEDERVQKIMSFQGEWGNEMCTWLVENKIDPTSQKTIGIMNKLQEWGQETTQYLLMQRIGIDMTVEMVTLSLGKPSDIDNRVVTTKDEKFRYIYGIPRKGAAYIWFKNGKVTKIKN